MDNAVVLTVLHLVGDPIAAYLEEHGIHAVVRADDCGGLDPLAFGQGVEVRVAAELSAHSGYSVR